MARQGDLLRMRVTGPLTELDVEGLRALVQSTHREEGACFLIADVSGLTGIDARARRSMTEWGRLGAEHRVSGVAAHGVSFAARTVITLTVNAVKLMGYSEVEVRLTRDEADALRWISARRSALLADGP